ncbi:MAG: SusD/RagB family nutrient-binding outer membrane lipoprotein [Cytophagales bacterium]|jgi:hypothetical protein|nr:SusD/RagB family nutrient-binding outer membrane lipoprotein [Cytophagales bacterium]
MKKIAIILFSACGLIGLNACDAGFDEMNVNKTAAIAINPVFALNNAVINISPPSPTVQYEVGIVQQIVSPNSGVLTGANFNQDNRDYTQATWQRYFRSVIRNTYDVIATTKDPSRTNLVNMAKILQSYAFLVLTDTYGDIPYTEAGKGYTDQKVYPKYDKQQVIYTGIIKEISDAVAALDASKTRETADVLFGGDVAKWKKFGNSLLLRIGMRLSKVDATQAQSLVSKALAGGVITTNADNVLILHDANYLNSIGQLLNATEANNFYLAAPFVDYLKKTNDPRLRSIAVRYVGATSGTQQTPARAVIDPAVQIGMPFGFDNSSISGPVKTLGLASFYDFSQADRTRMNKTTARAYLVTASQTNLLLAEAVTRGWVTGNAKDYFEAGVKAHMAQLSEMDANSVVSTVAVDAYLAANPFNSTTALEQINTQYWISCFLNGPEAFANFRRTGFPKLSANPFPGKAIKGDFINRLTYPNSEISVNSVNVKAAIANQGADDLDTKVWWHK